MELNINVLQKAHTGWSNIQNLSNQYVFSHVGFVIYIPDSYPVHLMSEVKNTLCNHLVIVLLALYKLMTHTCTKS